MLAGYAEAEADYIFLKGYGLLVGDSEVSYGQTSMDVLARDPLRFSRVSNYIFAMDIS